MQSRSRALASAASLALLVASLAISAGRAQGGEASAPPDVSVAAQYDTGHVYVAPEDFDRFVASFIATFGGHATKQGVYTVTPTPSRTLSQLVMTPHGTLSVFGYKTPIPYPFGSERTGYLVTDMDAALRAARASGAIVLVAPFKDAIGRDAIIEWPGGIETQLYWHTKTPSYPPLETIPENRVYVSNDAAAVFIRDFLAFAHGRVVSDRAQAFGIEIGRPGGFYRRVRIESAFGRLAIFVTDGHLPYPYGRETTGYEVANLAAALSKAEAAGAKILVVPYVSENRRAAMVEFPGGYIAEIHAPVGK
jgi:hypothetical protein